MKYFYDEKVAALIAVDEDGARVLPEISGGGVEVQKEKPAKKYKSRKPAEDEDSIDEEQAAAPGKRMSAEEREEMDRAIVSGETTGEIAQRFNVSTATVYMAKARLKKEGKL